MISVSIMGELNWNLNSIIFATLIAVPFFGLIVGESRLKRTTFAVFVGIVIAQSTTALIQKQIENTQKAQSLYDYVPIILFGITVLLMNVGPVPHHETSKKLSFRIMILSALLTLLLASSVLTFVPEPIRNKATDASLVLSMIYSTRSIWLVAAVLWLIVLNMWPQHDPKKK